MNKFLEENEVYDYQIIDGKYFIGKYNVMFGSRVRGGYLGDGCCDFDVCCGTNTVLMDKVIEIYKAKIEKNISENKAPRTDLLTMSQIKPIFNDLEYMQWLVKLKVELDIKVDI